MFPIFSKIFKKLWFNPGRKRSYQRTSVWFLEETLNNRSTTPNDKNNEGDLERIEDMHEHFRGRKTGV